MKDIYSLTESTEKYPKDLVLSRTICSTISIVSCLFIVCVYICLCIKVKCSQSSKSKQETQTVQIKQKDNVNEEDQEDNIAQRERRNSFYSKKGKLHRIGLGSHLMFFLILNNLFWHIFSVVYGITYYDHKPKQKESLCLALSFFHNLFDLSSTCWTSMVTHLFYMSTKSNEFKEHAERNQLIFGFIYSTGLPLIVSVIPFFGNAYGYAETHCSFDYNEKDELDNIIFMYTFTGFITLNVIYNIITLIKVALYYKKKLEQLKATNNEQGYKVVRVYSIVFYFFPFFLLVTRGFKGLNRGIVDFGKFESIKAFFGYTASITFCGMGTFNSFVFIYFFRGVFKCGGSNTNTEEEEENGDTGFETGVDQGRNVRDSFAVMLPETTGEKLVEKTVEEEQ